MTTDMKKWWLIGVTRDNMEEALKSLQIQPKVFTRRFSAMWNILLACEEDAKNLSG